jgi:cell shape-determining protein MreC
MSYRDLIKKRIAELEEKIRESEQDRERLEVLRSELTKLSMQDFEEDMREESGQQLLKG